MGDTRLRESGGKRHTLPEEKEKVSFKRKTIQILN